MLNLFFKILLFLQILPKEEYSRRKISAANKDIILEIFRYCIVGGANTAFYFLVAILFYRYFHIGPLKSNLFALSLCFLTGFVAHNYFTYQQQHIKFTIFIRFIILQIFSIILSQIVVYVIVIELEWVYEISLLLSLLILPPLCWTSGKFWVFKGIRRAKKIKAELSRPSLKNQ